MSLQNVIYFSLPNDLGPGVQSIVSLTSSLRGQLVQLVKVFYDFITKYTDIFC